MLCLAVAGMWTAAAFAAPSITDGKLVIAAGETFDLATAAQPIELDRLENSGTLKNSPGDAITLTVTNCVLGGTVQDKINIVKVGDGAFALNNPDMNQMAGKLDIQSGSLTVTVDAWRVLELPVKDGLSFHLDAADLPSSSGKGMKVAAARD